ncbi:MAG: hypothetical protein KDD33_09775 [Bdellovibrionales bacterium]|nr:hypothetical protein [Bdellovibrionales bacterium]
MNFWESFYQESMGSPWVIASPPMPVTVAPAWTFVLEVKHHTPHYQQMVDRMIKAIGKTPTEVSVEWVEDISQWRPREVQEKALLFGVEGALGKFEEFETTLVMVTHDIEELGKDPRKKKEAWLHLQKFAGLK